MPRSLFTLLFAAAGVSAFAGAAQAGGPKVGVVDVQRVMEAAPAWTTAVGALKRDWEKTRSELEAKQEVLKKEKERLDAKRVVSDPGAISEEEKKLLEQANQFRMMLMQSQQEFSQREAKLKDAMLGRVERVVYALAEGGDYAYIFEMGTIASPNVLYHDAKIDLTDQVIEQYKKAYKDQPLELAGGEAPKSPQQ